MSATTISIMTVLFACVIGAIGAVLIKRESNKVSFRRLIVTPLLIAGVGCYGISTVLFVLSLKGNQLSILYPLVSTTYVWIAVFSALFLGENIGRLKAAGILCILVGVSVIGFFR